MATQTTSDNQALHNQLEQAKETLNRLRCINGCTPTCFKTSKKCQGCGRHSHDVTIGKCSVRDGKCTDQDGMCTRYSGGESHKMTKKCTSSRGSRMDGSVSRVDCSFSRVDLERLHRQIDGLEESVSGPILSYLESMERRDGDMSDAVDTIRRQLLKHERVCPAMNVSSSGISRNGSDAWANDSEDIRDLQQKLDASQKMERETRVRAEGVGKELEICREKLEKSETRVKDLFRSISQRQATAGAGSSEALLETQLLRQQQLTETYFKESTSKDREISFLTIEKYNLESEVGSLVADLESSNKKRHEVSQERKRLEMMVQECRKVVATFEQQLNESKSEMKRVRTQCRVVLEEERARGEKNSDSQNVQEKEIKELRKKCKKYEDRRSSQKGIAQQLEAERNELLAKAKNLSNEYRVKSSECDSLREENQRLAKEISVAEVGASLSKKEYSNSKTYIESLKSELAETKSSMKTIESYLQESKVSESKSSAVVTVFNQKEASFRVLIESAEKERTAAVRELKDTKKRELDLKNEIAEFKEKLEKSRIEVQEMSQICASVKADLDLTREKYFQLKKSNDELVLYKNDAEKSHGSTHDELKRLKASCDELGEKNGQFCADLKAYKRIVAEKEGQLKQVEHELAQLHKTKDRELKELLRKDREIAFLKARVSSTERRSSGSSRTEPQPVSGQHDPGNASRDAEIYLERIVELESECKAKNLQIDEFYKSQYHAKKDAQRSDSLKQELADQDEEVQKLRREVSRSKQVIEELRDKEDQLEVLRDEREKFRLEVTRLQAKVEEVSELKQVCEKNEEEMRALRRMSSEEVDLEGKVSRLKDRCREKDEEIEELHQKVISLQVKMKDFMQQNSLVEEQMRGVKDRHSVELNEKEKISQALKTAETKYRSTEAELEEAKTRVTVFERDILQTKRLMATLESENEQSAHEIAELTAENNTNEDEMEKLRKQVEDLEEAAKENEETTKVNDEIPDGESTPLENSLENSLRLSIGRSGRASIAFERVEVLEEENVQLLYRQRELEDELDAAEEHAQELKNALKAKRENVNELHAELDTLKERLKVGEKARVEMTDENEQFQRSHLLSQQKVEDLKTANERYIEESDEVEKALTAAERKIGDLEKKLEEVSGKCAGSEGQLQSVTERLARKEKELKVVETHVDEQRKLCHGYKASAEKQETLVEKLRLEKVTVDEAFLAMKLEMAKKEGSYKAGKEKINELQTRLYEIEDKFSGKANEYKKLGRENERLKREIKELEIKLSDLQSLKKSKMSVEVEKSSGAYNTKFVSLNTSVKGNSQNVEGLDTKLYSAQNKISTLEVALANDLRKFSLSRASSDVSRRGYSPNDNQLSPISGNFRKRRSSSSTEDRESVTSLSPFPRGGSSASFSAEVEQWETTGENLYSRKSQIEIKTQDLSQNQEENNFSQNQEINISQNQEEETNFSQNQEINISQNQETNFSQTQIEETNFFQSHEEESNFSQKQEESDVIPSEESNSEVESVLFEADPFLSSRVEESLSRAESSSDHVQEKEEESFLSEAMVNEACEIFRPTSTVNEEASIQETCLVYESVTCSTAVVTGVATSTSITGSQDNWNMDDEKLIYF